MTREQMLHMARSYAKTASEAIEKDGPSPDHAIRMAALAQAVALVSIALSLCARDACPSPAPDSMFSSGDSRPDPWASDPAGMVR